LTVKAEISADESFVFQRNLDALYPDVDKGEGVHLYLTDGTEILDACSGGAMVACLGHGVPEIVDALARQTEKISYVYNHHFTNDEAERLADRVIDTTAPEMDHVRFVSGGSEANETAIRLARQYHVERGDNDRWRIISPAHAYHGATMGTLSLTGRPSLQSPFESYLPSHLHLLPTTLREDPSGEAALAELDRLLEEDGSSVSAFFCEPISASAMPGYSPPEGFWRGLDERRRQHGFLIGFDEVVTGMGRTGSWFAYQQLPIQPDIVTLGKGLGAGYFPVGGMICTKEVYDVLANGSADFEHGHTWDAAPLPCAIGNAVIDYILEHGLIDRVRDRGPRLREELNEAVGKLAIVREVRGVGFLLGVELVDPRDSSSLLPAAINVADLVDQVAYENGVLVTSSHASADGLVPDQTLLSPAFTATDDELSEMIERFKRSLEAVEEQVLAQLAKSGI
jgi:hypothetical protein